MTPQVMEKLNESIGVLDNNFKTAKQLDIDIKKMKTEVFIKNTKDVASSNERLWERIYAHSNKK